MSMMNKILLTGEAACPMVPFPFMKGTAEKPCKKGGPSPNIKPKKYCVMQAEGQSCSE